MPIYDIYADDGTHAANCEALELAGPKEARDAVLAAFPDMVSDIMPDGDKRTMRVSATDGTGATVYSATLTLDGSWGPG